MLNFEDDDRFGLESFSQRLEQFLLVENDYVEGSLVVALNAGFGAGKSTFIEMWQQSLLSRRGDGKFAPMPLLLNAWESDHCGDPLLAILAGLIEAADNWKGTAKPATGNLKEATKDVLWFGTGIASEFAAKWTGVNAVKASELAVAKKEARSPQPPNLLQLYQNRVEALKLLKQRLAECFGGPAPKVIIFVDELDRCRPDYAVNYLETVKHVFDTEGLVFILAVDLPHLECSAKALFGGDLDFNEYFRKFCHRVFELPQPNEAAQSKLAQDYVTKYLVVEGRRMSQLNPSHGLEGKVVELTAAFKLRPRQVQEAFRILGHTMQTVDQDRRANVQLAYAAGAILLSFYRVARPDSFQKLRKSNDGNADFCREISRLMSRRQAEWWMQLVLSGSWEYNKPQLETIRLLHELGYEIDGEDGLVRFLSAFGGTWTQNPNQIKRIADVIEDADSL
jgi:hypothetical protein